MWWLIFQSGSGKFSFQIQTAKWDSVAGHAWEEAWWPTYIWKDEEGETCTSWELIMLQHHKIGEKRTNAYPEQFCQTPPKGGGGGGTGECLGTLELHPRECLCTTTTSGAGERGVSTGLTCRRKEEGKRGMRTSLFALGPETPLSCSK